MKTQESQSSGKTPGRSLNILFVAGCWYPHEEQPLQGLFIRRHAEAVALQHEVTVLHLVALPDGPNSPEIHLEKGSGVREIRVRFRCRPTMEGGALASQWAHFVAGRHGCRELRKMGLSPDLLHFHVVPSAGLTIAVKAVFPRRPHIVTEHWTGYVPESGVKLSPARRLYTGQFFRSAAAVTVVSEFHERMMRDLNFGGQYVVIPNVVDTSVFRPPDKVLTGPIRLVHVSSLRPVKRVPDLVQAVVSNLCRGIDLELHIIGDGPSAETSRSVALDAGVLGKRVFFYGELDDKRVAARVRASDCSVLFSDFENSPCVVGEALACGIPMLAPRIAGIPEHITTERGVLISPGDEDGLVEAMGDIVRRGRTWDSGAIRSYAVEKFSQQAVGCLFDDVYSLSLDPGKR